MPDREYAELLHTLRRHALSLTCAALLAITFGALYGRILYLESAFDAVLAGRCDVDTGTRWGSP